LLLADQPCVVIRPDRYVLAAGSLGEVTRQARALLDPPDGVS
jgi:hypothetical protein